MNIRAFPAIRQIVLEFISQWTRPVLLSLSPEPSALVTLKKIAHTQGGSLMGSPNKKRGEPMSACKAPDLTNYFSAKTVSADFKA